MRGLGERPIVDLATSNRSGHDSDSDYDRGHFGKVLFPAHKPGHKINLSISENQETYPSRYGGHVLGTIGDPQK